MTERAGHSRGEVRPKTGFQDGEVRSGQVRSREGGWRSGVIWPVHAGADADADADAGCRWQMAAGSMQRRDKRGHGIERGTEGREREWGCCVEHMTGALYSMQRSAKRGPARHSLSLYTVLLY